MVVGSHSKSQPCLGLLQMKTYNVKFVTWPHKTTGLNDHMTFWAEAPAGILQPWQFWRTDPLWYKRLIILVMWPHLTTCLKGHVSNGWKPLIVSHHPTKFGGNKHSGSWDVFKLPCDPPRPQAQRQCDSVGRSH